MNKLSGNQNQYAIGNEQESFDNLHIVKGLRTRIGLEGLASRFVKGLRIIMLVVP